MLIEGLEKCKKCNIMPNFEYNHGYFSFICPVCKCSSHTAKVHGVEQAICDWNNYHTNKKWSTPEDASCKSIRKCSNCIYWKNCPCNNKKDSNECNKIKKHY